MRRALAIQMIITKEWGLAVNENPLQGAFVVDELTDLVEAAVLAEFDRISERGGVLGAMETGYQRGRIQDESMLYEHRKHDGSLPIVGVNTFRNPHAGEAPREVTLARASEAEKEGQLARVTAYKEEHRVEAAGGAGAAQGVGDVGRERLRRAHGCRPRVFAAAGHRGVLRGGRAVPPQRLAPRRAGCVTRSGRATAAGAGAMLGRVPGPPGPAPARRQMPVTATPAPATPAGAAAALDPVSVVRSRAYLSALVLAGAARHPDLGGRLRVPRAGGVAPGLPLRRPAGRPLRGRHPGLVAGALADALRAARRAHAPPPARPRRATRRPSASRWAAGRRSTATCPASSSPRSRR